MTTNNACNISAITGTKQITQAGHGFVAGNVLYLNSATWTKAIATSAAAAEVVGVVLASIDANTFLMQYNGYVQGLSGLASGSLYYLDPTTAGALTATAPTAPTQIVKPLLVADSATSGYWINLLGVAI